MNSKLKRTLQVTCVSGALLAAGLLGVLATVAVPMPQAAASRLWSEAIGSEPPANPVLLKFSGAALHVFLEVSTGQPMDAYAATGGWFMPPEVAQALMGPPQQGKQVMLAFRCTEGERSTVALVHQAMPGDKAWDSLRAYNELRAPALAADPDAPRKPLALQWHYRYDDGYSRTYFPHKVGLLPTISPFPQDTRDWTGELEAALPMLRLPCPPAGGPLTATDDSFGWFGLQGELQAILEEGKTRQDVPLQTAVAGLRTGRVTAKYINSLDVLEEVSVTFTGTSPELVAALAELQRALDERAPLNSAGLFEQDEERSVFRGFLLSDGVMSLGHSVKASGEKLVLQWRPTYESAKERKERLALRDPKAQEKARVQQRLAAHPFFDKSKPYSVEMAGPTSQPGAREPAEK